jgi:hypothetical protein
MDCGKKNYLTNDGLFHLASLISSSTITSEPLFLRLVHNTIGFGQWYYNLYRIRRRKKLMSRHEIFSIIPFGSQDKQACTPPISNCKTSFYIL